MRARIALVAALSTALAVGGVVSTGSTTRAAADEGRLIDLVNPFIGSQNDGNTFPGAAVPFGMVQMSPDTGHNVGYRYDQDRIRGFSTVHLSGVGCGLGGTLPVLPTIGAVNETDYGRYAARKDAASEKASRTRPIHSPRTIAATRITAAAASTSSPETSRSASTRPVSACSARACRTIGTIPPIRNAGEV